MDKYVYVKNVTKSKEERKMATKEHEKKVMKEVTRRLAYYEAHKDEIELAGKLCMEKQRKEHPDLFFRRR